MIPKALPLACLLIGSSLHSHSAIADPLATGTIPDNARWIIHLNVDAARGTPLWELGRARFVEPNQAQITQKVRTVELITGLKLPQDLHDVTLYGNSFDENAACFYIHARFNQETTTTFLKNDSEFTTDNHNGHTIMTWRDHEHDRLLYGCFAPGDIAIVSPSAKMLEVALDTLDGKHPSLKPSSPLAPPLPATAFTDKPPANNLPVAWIAATGIDELPKVQKVDSPFLLQVEDASISISLGDDKVSARLSASAKSEKAAQQIYASAEGVKAMVNLWASDDHALPRVKMLANAMQTLSLASEGKQVTADWFLGMDKIEAFVDLVQARNAAAAPPSGPSAPRTEVAVPAKTSPVFENK